MPSAMIIAWLESHQLCEEERRTMPSKIHPSWCKPLSLSLLLSISLLSISSYLEPGPGTDYNFRMDEGCRVMHRENFVAYCDELKKNKKKKA